MGPTFGSSAGGNPIKLVRQSAKRERAPAILDQVAGPPTNLSKQATWTMCISRISCPFCTQFPSVPQILLTKGIWHYNGFSAVSKVLLSSIREIRCALPFPCPSSEGMNTRARRR
jgi:hypothetical protein